MTARYHDPERDRGNLEPGQTLLGEPIIEVVEGRSYSWPDEIERQKTVAFHRHYAPRAPRPTASFNHRSLRRS